MNRTVKDATVFHRIAIDFTDWYAARHKRVTDVHVENRPWQFVSAEILNVEASPVTITSGKLDAASRRSP